MGTEMGTRFGIPLRGAPPQLSGAGWEAVPTWTAATGRAIRAVRGKNTKMLMRLMVIGSPWGQLIDEKAAGV